MGPLTKHHFISLHCFGWCLECTRLSWFKFTMIKKVTACIQEYRGFCDLCTISAPHTWLLVFSVLTFLKGDHINWTLCGKTWTWNCVSKRANFSSRLGKFLILFCSVHLRISCFFSWFTLEIQNLSLNSWLDKCFSLSLKIQVSLHRIINWHRVRLHKLHFLLESAAIIAQSSQLLVSGRAFQMREVHGCTEFPESGRSISQMRWPWLPLGTLPTTTVSSTS